MKHSGGFATARGSDSSGGLLVRDQSLLLSEQSASPGHRRIALASVAALTAALLGILAIGDRPLPYIAGYDPVVDSIMFLIDVLTAVLLYSQYAVGRQRSLLALAMGYLFAGLILVPHVLTFPGNFSPAGLLGGNVNTSFWLYYIGRLGLFSGVLAYALLKEHQSSAEITRISVRASISGSILVVVVLVLLLTSAAIHGPPGVMRDPVHGVGTLWRHVLAPALVLFSITIIGLLWRQRSSVLTMWLLVAQWAWSMETLLLSLDHDRFSVFWYGAAFGRIASCFVLVALVYETTRLYAQVTLSAEARSREGERQRLALQAVTASLTHELRQPLAAILMNGEAARALLAQNPPNLTDARGAMDDVAADAHRATNIISSVNVTLQGVTSPLALVSIDEVVGEALKVVYGELRANAVVVQLNVPSDLPTVLGNRSQLMQVLVNLITNAVEAMANVTDRPRLLTIDAALGAPATVSIRVSDSGTGVGTEHAARIFEPFFTTKSDGTGLGLAICRRIMEAHGGHISAYPGTGQGSVFEILLPAT